MRTISVLVPCYNEEENVANMANALVNVFDNKLSNYNYEIVFIDNASTDKTKDILRGLCGANNRIKAIFNIRNFGQNNSPYYGILQTTGDCTISMSCDFQDPVELLPAFVNEWEQGAKVVCAIKSTSKEKKIMYFLRSCYYKIFKHMSDVNMIQHFTGFGLYDKSVVDILRKIDDPNPFFRGLIAEYGFDFSFVEFEQPKRRAGKTHNNFKTLYSIAMRSFTNYTKMGIRAMSVISFVTAIFSLLLGVIFFILKLLNWNSYQNGTIPIILLVLFFGSLQLFFIGLIGEYLFNLKAKIEHRPLVIEEERINYDS